MSKGNHKSNGLSEQAIKQLKNNQYKKDELQFLSKHSEHCNLFSVTTDIVNDKLIAIYHCKRCRSDKTFYFNLLTKV